MTTPPPDESLPEVPLADRLAAEAEQAAQLAAAVADVPRLDLTNEANAVRELGRALRRAILPDTYARMGRLVQVAEVAAMPNSRGGKHLDIQEIEPAHLRRLLAHHAHCYRMKREGRGDAAEWVEVEVAPSAQVCRDVLSDTRWAGLAPLHGVVTMPVLRPNGTLVQEPGYDEATGLFYAPALDLGHIPARPSEAEVDEARRLVLDVVLGDFPFVDKADRANYLALLVTPILRSYTGALAPLGAVTAATAGTGKTLLAGDIPAALYGLTSRPWVADDAEVRKAVSTVLTTSTKPVVLFDNVPEFTAVDSPTLAKLLTSAEWDDRILGTNNAVNAINDRLWLATGNAMSFGGDMPSRTVLVRLDAKMPRPDLRGDFTIPDLNAWLTVEANRAALLRALLVMVVDWTAAGGRSEPFTMRQFTRWASAAGGFLAHHGVYGLLGNADALDERDDEGALWLGFCDEWYDRFGAEWKSATEVAKSAEPDWTPGGFGGDVDPWNGRYLVDGRGQRVTPIGLGKRLKAKRDRFFGGEGGYRLEMTFDSHSKTARYRVVRATDVPPAVTHLDEGEQAQLTLDGGNDG